MRPSNSRGEIASVVSPEVGRTAVTFGERTQGAAGFVLPEPGAVVDAEATGVLKGFCGTGSGFPAVPEAGKVRGGSTRVCGRAEP
ncbi:hypothetical protein [Thermopirellula anaerolimosa]